MSSDKSYPVIFSLKRYGSVPGSEPGGGGSTPTSVTKVYSPIAQVVERNAVNVDVRSANLRRGANLSTVGLVPGTCADPKRRFDSVHTGDLRFDS